MVFLKMLIIGTLLVAVPFSKIIWYIKHKNTNKLVNFVVYNDAASIAVIVGAIFLMTGFTGLILEYFDLVGIAFVAGLVMMCGGVLLSMGFEGTPSDIVYRIKHNIPETDADKKIKRILNTVALSGILLTLTSTISMMARI